MILDFYRFVREAEEYVRGSLDKSDHDRVFRFGDADKGFAIYADRFGWRQTLDGVAVRHMRNIASPLTNLQAAITVLRDATH